MGKTNREDIASLFHLDSEGPYLIDDLLHDFRNMESIDRLNELLDEFDDASY